MASPTAPIAARRTIASLAGSSLGTRIFLVTGMLIALAVTVAVVATSIRSAQVARAAVEEALAGSQSALASFQDQRYAQLRLMSRLVAGDPNFVAYVAEGDPLSARDLLAERQTGLGSDFAIVLDRTGRVLARTDQPGGAGEDLSRRRLVAAALAAGEAAGVWQEGERLYHAVAVPLVSGQYAVEGMLITGFAVSDELAREVKRIGGADVAWVSLLPEGPRLAATTLSSGAEELLRALSRRAQRIAADSAGAASFGLTIDGRTWRARAMGLRDAGGDAVGATVTLASLDQRLAPFRRIQNALVLVGVLAIAAAFALSYALSRRIVRPVQQLVEAAEAARAGDYDRSLTVSGEDEIGRLARAFGALLADLRERRDMETYLATLSRNLPDESRDGRTAAAAAHGPIHPGTVFGGRFEVLGLLGAGGMGEVYKARDRELDDVVALKTLRSEIWRDPEALERLKGELRLARRITHRNVLRTYDFGELDGVPFISMEYVPGLTLRELLDQAGRLPYGAGLRVARHLCAGLEAAHALNVVHRDIKPENLMLEPTGNVKLADFGIARSGRRNAADAPRSDTVVGTLRYMAPEQLLGQEPDVRADVYSCGVVLYEVFTGRRPFDDADPATLSYRQMHETPPAPRTIQPDLPEALSRIVMRCLAREPDQRFPNAGAVLEALEHMNA